MAIGKITGSVVADNTLTESNLAFGVSGQSAASAWATDTLKVNIIESDDSTAIQLNDSLNISGTLSANIIDVNTITSGDSTAVEFQDNVSVTGSVIIGGYHPNRPIASPRTFFLKILLASISSSTLFRSTISTRGRELG